MLGSRTIRILAAVFVCMAVFSLLWPRATGYVSTFAVVNAPVLTVRAPVNGVIVSPSPGLAAPVSRDEVLFDLLATQTSRTELSRLRAEAGALEAEAKALLHEEHAAEKVVAGLMGCVESIGSISLLPIRRMTSNFMLPPRRYRRRRICASAP